MATLAERLDRAIVTATVRIPIFDDWVSDIVVRDNPVAAVAAGGPWPRGHGPELERDNR